MFTWRFLSYRYLRAKINALLFGGGRGINRGGKASSGDRIHSAFFDYLSLLSIDVLRLVKEPERHGKQWSSGFGHSLRHLWLVTHYYPICG
jgi:hypothetical protein